MIRRPPRSTLTDTRFPYTSSSDLSTRSSMRLLSILLTLSDETSATRSPAPYATDRAAWCLRQRVASSRSEEPTSELLSLMRISYAVFCLKNKTNYDQHTPIPLLKHI